MCGLAGFFALEALGTGAAELLREMGTAIAHRGPDSADQWADPAQGIGLAHRRLAIVELSDAGAQPMSSVSGRYVLAYNGEIYNHAELRVRLEQQGKAPSWRGHSDTETLLACIEAWGLEESLKITIGMFALALWDKDDRQLSLARDRLGEKPLYYGWQGEGSRAVLLFGSELKSLLVHPAFEDEVDRDALGLYMRHGYIPAPFSIYRGIGKLPPGTFVTMSRSSPGPEPRGYWSAREVARHGAENPLSLDPDRAVSELDSLLSDAVGKQMMSDVPLGAFLSGGIDSSTIVSLMQKQSERPVKTFTIGFDQPGFNEAEHAQAVAKHLGTDHTELYVTADDALGVIPSLPILYDEPFADSSQLPTYLVAKLARQHVTVALSGDGGDELFGGYDRYYIAERLWKTMGFIPRTMRRAAGRALALPGTVALNRLGGLIGRPTSETRSFGGDIQKGARLLGSRSAVELAVGIGLRWGDRVVLNHGRVPPQRLLSAGLGRSPVDTMMENDLLTYLPDDILAKVDRAAMAVSLETRVPFLDPRVVEFAWRLPPEYKRRRGQTKWALRELLFRYIPRVLIERPKMGFSVPIHAWLRGPLREWAEELLSDKRLREERYFDADIVRATWNRHLSGQANEQAKLWTVLMFQAWLDHRKTRSQRQMPPFRRVS